MTDLTTLGQSVLANLATLLTGPATGLRQVHVDPVDAFAALPCLVVFDDGMREARGAHVSEIAWRLRLQGFVQRGRLDAAVHAARDLRAAVIDQLDTDLRLGLPAEVRTAWDEEGVRLADLEYPAESGTHYAGFDGVYVVYLRRTVTFT